MGGLTHRIAAWLRRRPAAARVADALPHAAMLLAADGSIRYANPAFCARFGAGRGLAALHATAADEEARAALMRLERTTGAAEVAFSLGGGRVATVVSVSRLDDGGTLWLVADAGRQQAVLDRVAAAERELARLIGDLPLGVYVAADDGRILFLNRTLAGWLDRPVARRDELFEPGAAPGELWLRRGDGRRVPVGASEATVLDPASGEARVHGIVRELGVEREREAARELAERRFRTFFEEAPVGIAILDGGLAVRETNRAFAALGGWNAAALAGRLLLELIDERNRPETRRRLAAALAGAAPDAAIEVNLAAGDRAATLYARPFEGGDSRPGLLVHAIDATRQQALEVQFAQSQKMLAVGQLAGGIAHDFNNLLTAIIGFSDLLLLRHSPGDPSFADLQQIRQNATRAANLTRQLLAFSRQQTLQPRVLNLTDVLADLSSLLRRLIGANIELKMQHGRDLGLVRADEVQLEQVIVNLAVNARDAMPDGGELVIRTANATVEPGKRAAGREVITPGEYVVIEVADSGHGIPPEHVGRIFEPFFSTKAVGAGTGLGLSTVYGIVKQTGGFIFVDSAPGRGARFTIYLPRYRGEAASEGARGEAVQTADLTGGGTVLLVEDEDPVRLFSARALRGKGYKVLEARAGDAALELVRNAAEPIDLLITDVVMPRLDGPSLIAAAREVRPGLPVICVSGYAEGAFRRKLEGLPDVHLLAKPFSLNQLAAKVKEVLPPRA